MMSVTIQMKPLCLYFQMVLFEIENFANLGIFVEFCLCPHLALKGLKGRVNHSDGRFSVLIWLS